MKKILDWFKFKSSGNDKNVLSIILVYLFCGIAIGIMVMKDTYDSKNSSGKVAVADVFKTTPHNRNVEVVFNYIKKKNDTLPSTLVWEIAQQINDKAKEYKLPYEFLVGLIEVESNFNPCAVSSANARGLMQVLVCDGIVIDRSQVHDIGYNISKGSEIFHYYLKQGKGDFTIALNSYSGGHQDYPWKVQTNMGAFMLFNASY